MEEALLAFVAIFITVDVVGVLPLYLSLTAGLPAEVQARLAPMPSPRSPVSSWLRLG